MTTHMDQLTAWWHNAEPGPPREGDQIISRYNGNHYLVHDHQKGMRYAGEVRILHRAPAPKPAWHDAVAVIAHVDDFLGAQRRVFVRRTADFGGICWEDELSEWPSDELIDPAPLIEAKVTDEMVQRFVDADRSGDEDISYLLAVALGIDPE